MRPAILAAAAIFALTATTGAAHANRIYLGSSVAAYGSEIRGAAALIQLRIPFGGRLRERAQPRLTLTAGPVWQEYSDSAVPGRYYVVPSSEIGFSLRGDPVLKVGGIDLSQDIILRLMARERSR